MSHKSRIEDDSSESSSTSLTMSSSTSKENTASSAGGASSGTVVLAMSFYMAVSIALVFANKFILSDKQLDAPLFLTWTQLLVAVVACALIAQLKPLFAPQLNFFPRFEYRIDRAKAVMPLSLIFIGMVYDHKRCPKRKPLFHFFFFSFFFHFLKVFSIICVSNMSRFHFIKLLARSPFSPTSVSLTLSLANLHPPYVAHTKRKRNDGY